MTRLRQNYRDLTHWIVMLAVGLATYLVGCHFAHAAVAANPGPAMEAGGNAAFDMLAKDGPWWAAIGALNVGLRLWLSHQHWLKQGRILSAVTALSAVLVAVAAWHWDGAPSSGILTATLAGWTLLLHPAPPAPPTKPGPALVTSVLVAIALVACTAAQVRQTAAAGVVAALDCEAQHLTGEALGDLVGLAEKTVQGWISGSAAVDIATLRAKVRADLALFKTDAGRCAIAGALAAIGSVVSRPGEAVSALVSGPDPTMARAAFALEARAAAWPALRVAGASI